MAINSDVDINLALLKLDKHKNSYSLNQSVPPHNIVKWRGPDAQPSDDDINTAWANWKTQDQYKDKREEAYPSIQEQLDMQYWDQINGTTIWKDAITKIKTDNPKS